MVPVYLMLPFTELTEICSDIIHCEDTHMQCNTCCPADEHVYEVPCTVTITCPLEQLYYRQQERERGCLPLVYSI